jgi:hypothetical protein
LPKILVDALLALLLREGERRVVEAVELLQGEFDVHRDRGRCRRRRARGARPRALLVGRDE